MPLDAETTRVNVTGGPLASPFAADRVSVTPTRGSTTVTEVDAPVDPPCTAKTTALLKPVPAVFPATLRTTAVYVTTIVWVSNVFRFEFVSVPKLSVTEPPPPPTAAAESTPANPPACDVLNVGDAAIESRLTMARPEGRVSVRTALFVVPSGMVNVT